MRPTAGSRAGLVYTIGCPFSPLCCKRVYQMICANRGANEIVLHKTEPFSSFVDKSCLKS
jgi:hypothetical protein